MKDITQFLFQKSRSGVEGVAVHDRRFAALQYNWTSSGGERAVTTTSREREMTAEAIEEVPVNRGFLDSLKQKIKCDALCAARCSG